ncbi:MULTISPECIES: DUF1033 family protein [Enterococcus]|uniref:DUF1033 family protein n=1 Tax=Enterococcus TaxID=1350 RepID=UPI00065E00E0|nr:MULTISPECIES: DUF1033 family protein [Enterococcus]KAF1300582.1 DNA-binding protein [Enterococcus sp. JM9B]
MYQVIMMYGDNEPWWFFEDWRKDIVREASFATFEEAQAFFEHEWYLQKDQFSQVNGKQNYLFAFWNEGDERWCEECDDYLQQYTGLALLKDYQPVAKESGKEFYETINSSGKAKRCQRPKQGIGR